VFINKTVINLTLDKVLGHVSVQTTIYILVDVSDNDKSVSVTLGKCVYVSVSVCVCVSFLCV
jgi:hypothetical protein